MCYGGKIEREQLGQRRYKAESFVYAILHSGLVLEFFCLVSHIVVCSASNVRQGLRVAPALATPSEHQRNVSLLPSSFRIAAQCNVSLSDVLSERVWGRFVMFSPSGFTFCLFVPKVTCQPSL